MRSGDSGGVCHQLIPLSSMASAEVCFGSLPFMNLSPILVGSTKYHKRPAQQRLAMKGGVNRLCYSHVRLTDDTAGRKRYHHPCSSARQRWSWPLPQSWTVFLNQPCYRSCLEVIREKLVHSPPAGRQPFCMKCEIVGALWPWLK